MSKLGDRVSYQDKQWVKEVIKCKGDVTAATKSFHPELNNLEASASGRSKLQNSREIRNYMSEQLDKQHLSLITANKKLKQHLDAKKPFVTKDDVIYVDDYNTQNNALERLYKLHGVLGANVQIDARQVHVNSLSNMSQEQSDRLEKILTDMDKLASKLDMSKNRIVPTDDGHLTDTTAEPSK